jgi:hypothetical protein
MELYMAEHPEKTAYPANNDAESWLSAYIPKAPVPPGGNPGNPNTLYRYAPLDGNNDGNVGDSYAIWDPNQYGGKYFAVGPGGAIGEGEGGNGVVNAINNATGLNLSATPTSTPLDW